ncbi:AlbA family DNA-binding domain-containing protein [Streptomyces sp. YPW6]|uniref:AlbA family DNA-binding domain-containing protein n=1 Tax=Streptomyces sp. YPW6 TaxID=2840373 RepID=UPI003EBDBBC0
MALEFDTRRPPVRASQYLELVKAIRTASTADELDWLEWKSTLDFRPKNKADKSARAHLARAIVGFANRQPDIALRNVEGHGLLVVGVDPEGYHGVDELDSVELERWITPYVGEEIDWRSTYVHVSEEGHDRLPVLIVTVSPPSWGDPIYCIRKEIPPPPRGESEQGRDRETIREATIFVRRTGRTDRARAVDIDRLGERLLRREQALDLDLTLQTGSVIPVVVPEDALDRVIDAGRRSLLSHLPSSSESTKVTLEQVMKEYLSSEKRPDPRSREEYLEEVNRYLEELRAATPKTLPEVAAFAAPRIELRLHNRTQTHLKDVQVRLELPEGVLVLVPTEYITKPFPSGLPQRPRPYGPTKRESLPGWAGISLPRGIPGPGSGAPLLPTTWDVEFEGTTVVFPGEDVRVGLSEDLAHFVAVAENQMSGTLQVSWTATATNMDGNAQGTVFLPVAPVQSLFDLIEAANSIAHGSKEDDSESQV